MRDADSQMKLLERRTSRSAGGLGGVIVKMLVSGVMIGPVSFIHVEDEASQRTSTHVQPVANSASR